jgi:hypothetical protein
MVLTRQSSREEQVASNAWSGADGGFIFADAPNAVTSAAVIIHQISMHPNITPLQVTRLLRVSSRASGGFTIIGQRSSSPARSFPLLTRIRWTNRRPDQPDGCLQTGKRCFTNSAALLDVANFGAKTIQKFSSTRTYLGVFASGGLDEPYWLAFDSAVTPVLVRPPRLTLPFHSQPVCVKLHSVKPRR